jgi:outer membrane lipoprotein-sorting protein
MLFVPVILLAVPLLPAPNPVITAIEKFSTISSYQVTLRSTTESTSEIIRYYYRKPGFVRMELVKPHKGVVIVYSPLSKKVRLRPFGFLEFLVFTFNPDNRFLKSSRGHRVDESDIGSLLKEVRRFQEQGETVVAGKERMGDTVALRVTVSGDHALSGDGIHSYNLWLDSETYLPIKASAYNAEGRLLEEVLMDDLQTDIEFPENFFEL